MFCNDKTNSCYPGRSRMNDESSIAPALRFNVRQAQDWNLILLNSLS